MEVYDPSAPSGNMAVLVPYDGSHPAQKAVEYAVRTRGNEEIVLLRVIEMASGSIEAGLNIVQEKLKELEEKEVAELSEEIRAILDAGDVDFRIETAVGKPAKEIISFAEENDVSEIIIGSHGRAGPTRVLLGSVAENVVRRAPMTVVVVR